MPWQWLIAVASYLVLQNREKAKGQVTLCTGKVTRIGNCTCIEKARLHLEQPEIVGMVGSTAFQRPSIPGAPLLYLLTTERNTSRGPRKQAPRVLQQQREAEGCCENVISAECDCQVESKSKSSAVTWWAPNMEDSRAESQSLPGLD